MNTRRPWHVGAALCCVAVSVAAQAPPKYSVERKLKFEPGTAQVTQGLKKIEAVREIVSVGYMIAAEDLNDDKYPEIIVLASSPEFCGSAGCRMVVLRNTGPARFEEIGRHFASPDIGVLRETANGYRLLATLDDQGAVALVDKTPLVHAMRTDAATQTAQATAPAGDASRRDLLGVKLGMTLDEAKSALRALKPPLASSMPDVQATVPLLPGGNFVPTYYAQQQSVAPGGTYKSATVQFSPPPGASRAVAIISQTSQYGAGDAPTVPNFLAALRDKFGEPHQRQQPTRTTEKLYWAWSPSGAPLPAAQLQRCDKLAHSLAGGDRKPLFRSPNFLNHANDHVTASQNAGCGLVAYAQYASDGSFVKGMSVLVADVAAADAALAETVQEVDRLARAQHSQALEEAKDRKPEL